MSVTGGVGWACTQLAHTVTNVTVFGTCSSMEKHDSARLNGVSHILSPSTYENELRSISPEGVHLVVDSIGGANFTISQRILRPLGRVVLTGTSARN
jgi:NADPH:quinone reductase-like Zn-dependent oxidoreductase